jgi:hypothetical protein
VLNRLLQLSVNNDRNFISVGNKRHVHEEAFPVENPTYVFYLSITDEGFYFTQTFRDHCALYLSCQETQQTEKALT